MSVLDQVKELLGLDAGTAEQVTFSARQVSPLADYQLGFEGTYEYVDDEVTHRVERRFDVYVPDDEEERPRAEVHEERYEDGEQVGEETTEMTVQVNPELTDSRLRSATHSFLEGWHEDHDPRPGELQDEE
ncbi:MAG: hypothetical protein ABEJ42_07160 [Halobacteriaceae archaeon]